MHACRNKSFEKNVPASSSLCAPYAVQHHNILHQHPSPFHLPASKQRMCEVNNTSTDFGFGLQPRKPLAVSTVAAVFNLYSLHERNHSSNQKFVTWIQQRWHAQVDSSSLRATGTSLTKAGNVTSYRFLPKPRTIPATIPACVLDLCLA